MSTRDRLRQTVLAPVDIADQAYGALIFVIDTMGGGRQAFYVDYISVTDGVVYGYRRNDSDSNPVIAVPVAATWTAMSTDVILFRTAEEAIRKRKVDGDAENKLVAEVFEVSTTEISQGPPVVPEAGGLYL